MFGSKTNSVSVDEKKIDTLLSRGVLEIIDKENLRKKLLSGKVLRVKLGIDPTSPNIHIGRAIQILKLKDFQDLGHKVVLIIGDFTGVIGDTSDKESERPMLSEEKIRENMKSYIDQAGKIINISDCEIKYNSEWLKEINYAELGRQANIFSLSDFISRENIKNRLNLGKRVSLRELLYPLMQGYDSVAVRAQVEIGGIDQKFNLLAGRELQRLYGQEPQDILVSPLIEGLDGRKMSSSWGNTINLFDSPDEMFGKVMSLRDDFIISYFYLTTRVSEEEIEKHKRSLESGDNPKKIKLILAKEIVSIYHGRDLAETALENFEEVFSRGAIPENIDVVSMPNSSKLVDIFLSANVVSSKSEFRRLISEGAITNLDSKKRIENFDEASNSGVYRIGKKRFIKIENT